MMGFTEKELKGLMTQQNIEYKKQEKLLPIMRENYDGYKFSLHDMAGKKYITLICVCIF